MAPQPTPHHRGDQERPESVRDNIIELGQRRRQFRERTGTVPDPIAPLAQRFLRPGATLGYFYIALLQRHWVGARAGGLVVLRGTTSPHNRT